MDPVANIAEQRQIAERVMGDDMTQNPPPTQDIVDDLERLAELVLALDEWRSKGGFDPYTKEEG